jgi:hypothetical protein
MRHILCAAALCAIASPAFAQSASPTTAPIVAQPTPNAILRAGAPVALRLLETITTKDKAAHVGQRINMEIAAPVQVNGVTVIPAGTPAWGEVTEVRNKGMWGKSGHITARALYCRVNGREIRLTGTFDDKGVTGTAGVVAAAVFVPVVGFFVTGTSATLPQGGTVNAFIDEDVELALPDTKPGPLVVPAPTPAASAPASQPVTATSATSGS